MTEKEKENERFAAQRENLLEQLSDERHNNTEHLLAMERQMKSYRVCCVLFASSSFCNSEL